MKRGCDGHKIPSPAKDERCTPVDGKQHRPMRFIYDGDPTVAHPRIRARNARIATFSAETSWVA